LARPDTDQRARRDRRLERQDVPMLTRLRQWRDRHEKARSLYGSIVTQARARGFYAHWGVPDTPEGRFETIALHLVLVLQRLGQAGPSGQRLARALTETFAEDLDDNLREMTVGDLAVPRHVKRAVAALHERHTRYLAALADSDDAPLAATIEARFASAGANGGLDVRSICAYIRRASHGLVQLPTAEVLAGRLAWPQTDAVERDVQHDEGGGRRVTEGEDAR
jgi:cytochrome b pre-mRNA-processing protein 3